MKNLYERIKKFFPSKSEIKKAISHFSKMEYLVFLILVAVLCISTVSILQKINKSFMVSVPADGGTLTEGIVGTPRFINPILASSPADQDMVSLIYSGLMRKNPDGTLVPDLALKYDVSPDGLTYIFTLKEKIFFHDERPVTADDIVFTVSQIKDPIIKSPRKGNWDGITVSKLDNKTVKFELKQPYASFLEKTTLGIMPKHLWDGSPIELNETNIRPIGSGPYKVESISKRDTGLIDYYNLSPFGKFILGKPHIKKITLRFYPNEDGQIKALEAGEVDQIGSLTPVNAKTLKEKNYRMEKAILPRVFGVFFNHNQNQIFTDKNIVMAINLVIDKENIVRDVLLGYGVAIDDPIPSNMTDYQKLNKKESETTEEKTKKALEILEKSGWQMDTDGFLRKTTGSGKKKETKKLEFSISTGNAPELVQSAELIKENLKLIGIEVSVKAFEIGNLNQNVIRPRKYESLLFGEIINHESDLFAFWHSSQIKDPGLNVAIYANARVDKILEDAFITGTDKALIAKKYAEFESEIKKDAPAVFLYSPTFNYIVSKNIKGFSMDHVVSGTDRFINPHLWYMKTENIWKIFSK